MIFNFPVKPVAGIIMLAIALTACVANSGDRLAGAGSDSASPKPVPISVTTMTKSTQSWNGSTLPAYPDGQPEVTILKIVIQPGVTLEWHKHPIINAGVLLSGELTVESAKQETLLLKAGDTIVELVEQWHHGINSGNVLLSFMPASLTPHYRF